MTLPGSTRPLVSVVIPVYNRGAAVCATLDSALDQTLPPEQVEVIVVDDGSTDATPEVLRAAYASHARVRLLRQDNGGVAAARNSGLRAARGDFIAFLDHDDRWLPAKLEQQLRAFQHNPRAGVVYCLWREVDENGQALPEAQQMTRQRWWHPARGRVYAWLCQPRNPLVSMSVPLVRTALLRSSGGFDPGTVPADDWDLWLRLARRCEFDFVPEELVLYTRHATQQRRDAARMGRAMERVFAKQWRGLLLRPGMAWFVLSFRFFLAGVPCYEAAKAALEAGQTRQVPGLAARVLRRHPLALLTPQWAALALRWLRLVLRR
jgi:glycosyltransferase involved in cell wall biosynthesis